MAGLGFSMAGNSPPYLGFPCLRLLAGLLSSALLGSFYCAMPNYVRWRERGAAYFFTVVTYGRRRLLCRPVARSILREAFAHARQRWPFDLFAIVLLPDHLHCLWSLPPEDGDFPKRWAAIKREFSRNYLGAGGREARVTAGHAARRI
jgi:putative transposase